MIKSKVYLAGPIRGIPDYKERFEKIEMSYASMIGLNVYLPINWKDEG